MDWLWLGVLFGGLLLIIFISEVVRFHFGWSINVTRKFVHVSTGFLITVATLLLESSVPLISIATVFIFVNYVAVKKHWLPGIHATKQISFGTFFYPISFLILIVLLWGNYKSILITSILIMAISDAAAAIVGENIKAPLRYQFSGEPKSVQGSLVMFSLTFIIAFLGLQLANWLEQASLTIVQRAWYAGVVAVLATAFESISYKGSDNLSVPLGAAFSLHFLISHSPEQNLSFTIGIGLALLVALLSYRFRFLSPSGAVATFLLGSIVFGIGKWEFSLPLLLFFVLSSLISKLGRNWKKKFADTFQKGGQRDIGQVFANGGVAGAIVLLGNYFPSDVWYFIFVGSIAGVTADTWGTELGVFSKTMPRLILNYKTVLPGTSGGVTWLGFFGGLTGSAVIVFLGSLATKRYEFVPKKLMLLIVLIGLLGSIVDSIIGATIQAQYKCPNCSQVTEKKKHCQFFETRLISGLSFVDNDMVNAACALSSAAFSFLAYLMVIK